MTLRAKIEELAAGFSGTLGVAAKNLSTGEVLKYQADLSFHPASTIKLPVLVAVYREIAAGRLSLDDTLPLDMELSMPDGGIMDGFTAGYPYPVRDLAHLMMTVSDNTATNLLIKRIGFAAVNETIAGYGMANTELTKYVGLPLPEGAGPSRTTPADMLHLLELLAKDRVVSLPASRWMLHTMTMNRHHHGVTRYIDDYDDELEPDQVKVRVASKSGWFRTVRNDVAVIWAPRADYVLAMFSRDCKDDSYKPDNEAAILLPRVSQAIYDEWGSGI